jgi:hypothetical protein
MLTTTARSLILVSHGLIVDCPSCHRRGVVDLAWMTRTGRGDREIREFKFRCKVCGSLATTEPTIHANGPSR